MNWEPVLELLAEERDVIAVDMPGFGLSDPLPEGVPHGAAQMGRTISAHLASLGVERPHVAGNSLGAWVALEMAADGEAASVCCISPAGLWGKALGPRTYDARARAKRLRSVLLAAVRTRRGRELLLRTSVARPDLLSADEAQRWLAAWIDAPGYEEANVMMRAEPFLRATEVDVPVTIAWGAEDRLVGRPKEFRMPRLTRYLEVPGWGHTPTRDDPEGVARLLLEASSGSAHDELTAARG